MSRHDSQPRPSPASNFEFTCHNCHTTFISKSSSCPACRASSARGEELTKKTIDDNDLKKGLR